MTERKKKKRVVPCLQLRRASSERVTCPEKLQPRRELIEFAKDSIETGKNAGARAALPGLFESHFPIQLLNHAVALTRERFESLPVEDFNFTATVPDHVVLL